MFEMNKRFYGEIEQWVGNATENEHFILISLCDSKHNVVYPSQKLYLKEDAILVNMSNDTGVTAVYKARATDNKDIDNEGNEGNEVLIVWELSEEGSESADNVDWMSPTFITSNEL